MYYINSQIKNLERIFYTESRKGYLKLDMNENPDFLPKRCLDEIKKSITVEDISMYPETSNLVKSISNSINFEADNICLTNGSDDGIRIIIQVFGKPGSNFVMANPTFEMYSVYTKMYGINLKTIEFDKNFLIDINKFLNIIDDNTSLVLILNPNSPIGKEWTEIDLLRIIEKSKENNAIVIIDEAYFYFNDNTFIDLINYYDNIIVLRTFSKAFSIAGCRIGYTVTNKFLSSFIKKCSSSYPVNILGIKSAEYLLNNPDVMSRIIFEYSIGKDYLINKLIINNYKYEYNGGNYILIKPRKSPKEIFCKLKEKNILIKKYSNKILKEWIRITICSKKTMNKFWTEFEKIDMN